MKIKRSIECWLFQRKQNAYLLLQCPETSRHPTYWQPITGGVQPKETVLEACMREVLEETGLTIQSSEIVTVLDEFRVWVPEYTLDVRKPIFTVETAIEHITISDEHLSYQWVIPEDVTSFLFWDSNKTTFEAVNTFYRNNQGT